MTTPTLYLKHIDITGDPVDAFWLASEKPMQDSIPYIPAGEIKTFWVVTKPTRFSTLADVCFETSAEGLYFQFAGGLELRNLHGTYTDEESAAREARALLEQVLL